MGQSGYNFQNFPNSDSNAKPPEKPPLFHIKCHVFERGSFWFVYAKIRGGCFGNVQSSSLTIQTLARRFINIMAAV